MSTSHYSNYRGPQKPPPNVRRHSVSKIGIAGLLAIDCVVLANSKDIVEAAVLVLLVLVNIWALNRI